MAQSQPVLENSIAKTTSVALMGLFAIYALHRIYSNKRNTKRLKLQDPLVANIQELIKAYSTAFNSSGTIEKIIPRVFETEEQLEKLTSNLFYRKNQSHLSSLTKSLSEPIYNLLDRGGKRWRPVLSMIIARTYGHSVEEVYEVAALCEIVHNGTLIVDDIEDSSTVRREKECVHLLYGIDISINAGNFMYFAPFNYLLRYGKLSRQQQAKVGMVFAEEMTSLHIGQGWDILWHNSERLQGQYPTQDDYLQMTAHKTGVLARLSVKLTCAYLSISNKETEVLSRFAETMGVAFQIQDDLLNLEGAEYVATKGYAGEDIHEGKITIMVIHTLNSPSVSLGQKERLMGILRKKTMDQEEIGEAIQLMRSAGSLENARTVMNGLVEKACTEIDEHVPEHPYRQYLKELAWFGIRRSK